MPQTRWDQLRASGHGHGTWLTAGVIGFGVGGALDGWLESNDAKHGNHDQQNFYEGFLSAEILSSIAIGAPTSLGLVLLTRRAAAALAAKPSPPAPTPTPLPPAPSPPTPIPSPVPTGFLRQQIPSQLG